MSRRMPAAATVVAVALFAGAAYAAWTTAGSGTGAAKGTTVQVPSTASAAPTSGSTTSSITVSWSAPSSGPAPTSYRVDRVSPAATVCSGTSLSCVDSGLSAGTTYTYNVYALVSNWASSAATASATTASGSPNFLLTPATGPHMAGTAFSVTVQARLGTTNDTSYTGSKTLTLNAPSAPIPTFSGTISPNPVTFDANGQATVSVTLYKAHSANTFTISEGTRSGSATETVNPRNTLSFSTCPATFAKNSSFSTQVLRNTADIYGNLADSSAVTVTLAPFHATQKNANFSSSSVSFASGGVTSGSATYWTASGNNVTSTLTGTASGYVTASCTLTTTN